MAVRDAASFGKLDAEELRQARDMEEEKGSLWELDSI